MFGMVSEDEEQYGHEMIEGLLQMLKSQDHRLSAKAAAALCNLCAESEPNREQVTAGGALQRLLEMLNHPADDVPFMQSAAAACLCNLAANPDSKITIAKSGAIETLVKVLLGSNLSAAAQAAGALWSLCVDNDHNKKLVANAGAVPFLVQLLKSDDSFTISQAAGALSECSIRNDANKTLVSASGAIPLLVSMLQAREAGALPILVKKLAEPSSANVLSPIAGAICNLSMRNSENRLELLRLGAADVLRMHTESSSPSLRCNALAALNQLEGRRPSARDQERPL